MVEWMQRAELQHADTELGEPLGLDAEHAQSLQDLLHVVTTGDDAEPGVRRIGHEAVERVGGHIALGPFDAIAEHFDLERVGERHADVPAERRRPRLAIDLERGQNRIEPSRSDLGDTGTISDRRGDLHRHPQASQARHREGVEAEIEHFLHRPRVQHREMQRDKRGITARRKCGRLRSGVVADQQHHTALASRSTETAVADRVARAIETGRFAVPHTGDAFVLGTLVCLGNLRTEDRRCSELLVESRHVHDVELVEQLALGLELSVVSAQWRALIAGDECRGVPALGPIGAHQIDRQAHEGLDARRQDLLRCRLVTLLQRELVGVRFG